MMDENSGALLRFVEAVFRNKLIVFVVAGTHLFECLRLCRVCQTGVLLRHEDLGSEYAPHTNH